METLNKISFDYAVVEQEKKIQVLRIAGEWKDIGTRNSFSEVMVEKNIDKVMCNEYYKNLFVINELNVPVLCMGMKDAIVAASAEGIWVVEKEQSAGIKPFVDQIEQQVMFAEKSWGSYEVIDMETSSMTIKVTLNPGHHERRHGADCMSRS